jgi:TonB family protein
VVGEVAITSDVLRSDVAQAATSVGLLQRGVPFDEVALDRSVRALYATGQFESIEVRTQLVDGSKVNVNYVVRLKGAARPRAIPGVPEPGDMFEIRGPKAPAELAAEALAEAQRTVAETQAELAKLRAERATEVARQQALDAAAERARVAAGGEPARVERPPAARAIVAPMITAPVPSRSGYTAPVIPIAQLDQRPVARFQARPRYPFQLRKNGVAGEAVVDFVVDAEGNVAEPVAVRMTHEEFGAAAVDAVRRWQFRPGVKDGRPVATQLQVPIVFTLNEN